MCKSSWYFWFGSADYMTDDGVSMESDHIDAALFSQSWKVIESLFLHLFHSPPSLMTKKLKPLNMPAIPCVSNTLLPPVIIKAMYKMYVSLPKYMNFNSQYMNFRHERSTTFHWSWLSKTSHTSFIHTWLKHTFPFCLATSGTDKDMETKSTMESKPPLLPQFLCSYTYTWHHARPKIFFPQAKNQIWINASVHA